MKYHQASFGEFKCLHCRAIISPAHILSGVNNRNHCPYCLWSCHLDLFRAGDRLSACKGQMRPIGLTMKKSRNRYRLGARGELMLIHECVECRTLSINRIAADDDPDSIIEVFHASLGAHPHLRASCETQGIIMLSAKDLQPLHVQLYGQSIVSPTLKYE